MTFFSGNFNTTFKVYSLNILCMEICQVLDHQPTNISKTHCSNVLTNCCLDYNENLACSVSWLLILQWTIKY